MSHKLIHIARKFTHIINKNSLNKLADMDLQIMMKDALYDPELLQVLGDYLLETGKMEPPKTKMRGYQTAMERDTIDYIKQHCKLVRFFWGRK